MSLRSRDDRTMTTEELTCEPGENPAPPESVEETTAAEPTQDVADRVLAELKPILAELRKKVESLGGEADFWKQLVERKQADIDKLYDENRSFRDGIVEQFKKKLVLGVIEQLDAAYKQISTFERREESEKNYKNLLQSFREIADDFQEMLQNRLDVIPFHCDFGEAFDPTRHHALQRESTDDPNKKDKTIVSRTVRFGYANGNGSILRPAMVEVFHYEAPLPSPISTEEHYEALSVSPFDFEETKTDEQDNVSL